MWTSLWAGGYAHRQLVLHICAEAGHAEIMARESWRCPAAAGRPLEGWADTATVADRPRIERRVTVSARRHLPREHPPADGTARLSVHC